MTHIFATRKGRAFRTRILTRDLWTCQMCGVLLKPGKRDARSAAVDHTRPIDLRPDLQWDEANCRSVCRDCHAVCDGIEKRLRQDAEAIAKAKLEWKPQRVGVDGWPIGGNSQSFGRLDT